jgi:UDP-N-acetylmuramate--alanine ligase
MVVEADESDGSFAKLNPTAAIITNIDLEHLDYHKNEENLELAFFNFLSSIPFYGFICLCTDHPRVQKLISKLEDKKIITYGLSANADVRATNIIYKNNKMIFTLKISNRRDTITNTHEIEFSMIGIHNVQNALATIATGIEMKIPIEKIKNTLRTFTGVQRRFQTVGNFKNTTIIDDYGHHPVEISAVLSAARQMATGKVFAIHQPHRYTRLNSLFEDFCSCFNEADFVGIMEVYSAGEAPIDGASSSDLVNGLVRHGHRNVLSIENEDDLETLIRRQATSGDVVICLGAGTISVWANNLSARLSNSG